MSFGKHAGCKTAIKNGMIYLLFAVLGMSKRKGAAAPFLELLCFQYMFSFQICKENFFDKYLQVLLHFKGLTAKSGILIKFLLRSLVSMMLLAR